MTHPPTKRRTGKSAIRAPLRGDRHKRDLFMFAGVGFSMLIIVGLYAASFPKLTAIETAPMPRWDVVSEEVFSGIAPTIDRFDELKSQIDAVVQAKSTQADTLAILKDKLESATATPEIPNP